MEGGEGEEWGGRWREWEVGGEGKGRGNLH